MKRLLAWKGILAVNTTNRIARAIVHAPILWGCLAALAFYVPLHTGHWQNAFALRYFAGHPIEHVATTLFFIGLAALAIKSAGLAGQFKTLSNPLLDAIPAGGQPVEHCEVLLQRVATQPLSVQDGYLLRRLHEALEYVGRKREATTLDDELRYLSELDVSRMHNSYALVRIIIWAIPILGLLGTVIGITAAVANLSSGSLESSIGEVTAGLGVAFDHTGLALALSIALMFSQYFVERYETRLVAAVDARVAAELVGRFESTAPVTGDPQTGVVRRMAEAVVAATEKLVQRQAELWQATVSAAHQQWSQLSSATGQQLEAALKGALAHSLKEHAAILAAGEQTAAEQNHRNWGQVEQALLQNAEAVTLQQRELVRQGEVLSEVVQASGQIARLETELNRNLSALAGAKHFEETVLSLSAAIQLLGARLGQAPGESHRVDLHSKLRTGQAA